MRLKKIPSLSELLAYKNTRLLHYFCYHQRQISLENAQQLLADLMSWLWLHAWRKSSSRATWFFGPLLILDELWHAFILHTRDYHDFCLQFFGEYVHHDIEPPGAEHAISPEELADFLSDAIDHLGLAWVERYFPVT